MVVVPAGEKNEKFRPMTLSDVELKTIENKKKQIPSLN